MAHLLRIIMINGHLSGVIELDLQGHSNICGTNASGKTTLQRLIPVFYGESPNKVVPKTRKKFDQFYLPYSDSYLVYEYRRESGEICLLVLTRKPEGGVQYRFISSPYAPELFLHFDDEQKPSAIDQNQLGNNLRQLKITATPKIDTISDFRCIIQNDFSTVKLSRQDTNRLKQHALNYSLSQHRLRHIEKLVSAVHAKEGKMDTLKTMLAAIFEEDGISLPTTHIKNTQVHQWVKQVRQSTNLDNLQQQLGTIDEESKRLTQTENTLWQLHPQLIAHDKTQSTLIADTQEQISHCTEQLRTQQQYFEAQREELNQQISQHQADINTAASALDSIGQRYNDYSQRNMDELAHAIEQLPQQRERLNDLQDRKQRMLDDVGSSSSQFDAQCYQVSEDLRHKEQRLQQAIDAQQSAFDSEKDQQNRQEQQLQNEQQEKLQEFRELAQAKIADLRDQQATLTERLKHPLISAEDQQRLELERSRAETLQTGLNSESEMLNQLLKQLQQAQTKQNEHLQQLNQQRAARQNAEQHYFDIKKRLEPAAGSLRAYLQENYPHWQYSVGKVLSESLLERKDLSPNMGANQQQILQLAIDLHMIEVPEYALDNEQLSQALEQANHALNEAKKQEKELEQQQEKLNSYVKEAEAAQRAAQLQLEQTRQDWQNAKALFDQLQDEQQQQALQLKRKLELNLSELDAQQQQVEQTLKQQLQQSQSDFKQFLLETQASWAEKLQAISAKIEQLRLQLKQSQEHAQQEIEQIKLLKDEHLHGLGLDPARIAALEKEIQALKRHIQETDSRRDELHDYRIFMQQDWEIRKPKLTADEHRSKQLLQQTQHLLQELRNNHSSKKRDLEEEANKLSQQIKEAQGLQTQLQVLLRRYEPLNLAIIADSDKKAVLEDLSLAQCLQYALQALNQLDTLNSSLREALDKFERLILKDADDRYMATWQQHLAETAQQGVAAQVEGLHKMLRILADEQQNLIDQGRNYGKDLSNFFTVFRDLNNRIQRESRRLSNEVSDELELEGISKSEIHILSTIDELHFWQPLKEFAETHLQWQQQQHQLPDDNYLNKISDVANLLRSDQQFSFESLLRIELHLNEGGSDLVIRNDRQLLESSSHGMAYLILCKYLLAFTRLLRGQAQLTIHWPIDEIGTLAYRNVEKLFKACDNNRIFIVGAFPNPESDVLTLFQQRYLIEKDSQGQRKLKRIQPQPSAISMKIQQLQEQQA